MSIERNVDIDAAGYWDEYYKGRTPPPIPSQFSVFVLNEIPDPGLIVELGCGSGRDSLFFASQDILTVGVDASASAIELCRQQARARGLRKARFLQAHVEDENLADQLNGVTADVVTRAQSALVYARFFVHAITDDQEVALFRAAKTIFADASAYLAVEFRTHRDVEQRKVTSGHYRRYVNPLEFSARARDEGFEITYFVDGFGFAKYREDDAHVARFILAR